MFYPCEDSDYGDVAHHMEDGDYDDDAYVEAQRTRALARLGARAKGKAAMDPRTRAWWTSTRGGETPPESSALPTLPLHSAWRAWESVSDQRCAEFLEMITAL